MFNNAGEKKRILANLVLAGHRKVTGEILLPITSDLMRTLNGDAQFIEFQPTDEAVLLLARSQIVSVEEIKIPAKAKLDNTPAGDGFDPYAELGVARDAAADVIREAYLTKVRLYHPDSYASVSLPREVEHYLKAMAGRITTAYSMTKPDSVGEAA